MEPESNKEEPDSVNLENRYDMLGFPLNCSESHHIKLSKKEIKQVLKRENKWLKMTNNWANIIGKNSSLVRKRCRKGIPHSMRARIWQYLCKSDSKSVMQLYTTSSTDGETFYINLLSLKIDQTIVDEISQDVGRQFPKNRLFSDDNQLSGQNSLLNVLRAFAIFRPEIGYCQGQGPMTAFLLMHMPEHETFWTLVRICDEYINGYFDNGLFAIQVDGDILLNLVKIVHPRAFKLMIKYDVRPVEFMIEWFMCLYCRTLPWNIVERIWDMFFYEGVKVLFRVGLVLIKETLPSNVLKNCHNKYDILTHLKNIPKNLLQEKYFIEECNKLPVNESQMAKEHETVLKQKLQQNTNTK